MKPQPVARSTALNRHAEASRLSPEQAARWQGLPLVWVDARPHTLTTGIETERPVLAMLDAGSGQAEIAFLRRTVRLNVAAGAIGVFAPGRQRYTRWRCEGARRILVDLDAGAFGAPDQAATPLRQDLEFHDAAIAGLLHEMVREIVSGCPGGAPVAEGLSHELLAQVWGRLGRRPPHERGRLCAARLRRVDALIAERMAEPLPLAVLADAAGLSGPHFTRLMKATVGLAPHRYVLKKRLEHAVALLQGSALPIVQIAAETGFAHQSHLTTTLRRLQGLTPAALRRRDR